ncbi:radical SAM/SPASM domain-containing protein [Desulfosarcina variabilis]|uniref:radical SAM/SPASM domain-containing protein n=1 Tax=Desulfosarcina variabilis TaxID=2300 RepID=UPI003AFB5688
MSHSLEKLKVAERFWTKTRKNIKSEDKSFFRHIKEYSDDIETFLSQKTCGSFLAGFGLYEGMEEDDAFIMVMEDAANRLYLQGKYEAAEKLILDVYRMKYEDLVTDRTFKYVKRVNFELTSICNLKCKYCTFESGKRKKHINLELFEKILMDIAECHPRLRTLALYMSGESLLHPGFIEILEIVSGIQERSEDFSPEVYLHTNGTLWTPEKNDAIMGTGVLDRVVWSIDGVDRDSFEDMRGVKGIYNKVLHNFEYFLNNHPEKVKAWVNNLRESEYLGKECLDSRLESLLQRADMVQVQPPRDLNQSNLTANEYKGENKSFCEYVFHTVVITTDGQMSLCCTDYNSENAFGDLKSDSFSDVYYSHDRMDMLKNMSIGQRRRIRGCMNCNLLHGAWYEGSENSGFITNFREFKEKQALQRLWKMLSKQYGPKEIVIFGAGKKIAYIYNQVKYMDHSMVGAVIDNYRSPYSCLFGHKPVFPDQLGNISPKAVIVTSRYVKEKMTDPLREMFGSSVEIIDFFEHIEFNL